MFDFTSLTTKINSEAPDTLEELFSQLDRKATHITLRPAQTSALAKLDEQRDKRDIVIKLSTGSGKTVVGLVYAEMMRRRFKGEPVLYLCPTNQLVDQVIQSAQAIGVQAGAFPSNGLPYSALAGESVLVCTYDKLFNSRNVFETNTIRPSCIVLDDVHAGINRVRGCFTAKVPDQCFDQFRSMLQPLCEATDPATWRGIQSHSQDFRYEVPYWVWDNIHGEAAKILEQHKDDRELRFCWNNISRYLELARVCISGTGAEITLPLAAVEENAAYCSAKHRLFMSASIKDGSSFIADLDCDPEAFKRVIEPLEDEGAGERMMLATSLISPEAEKKDIAEVCKNLSLSVNVVVLTSSTSQAKIWVDSGATLAKAQDFDSALEELKTSVGNYVVFPQRFDGVDLPDDACRVLVIDGVPTGDRLSDKIDAARQKDSPEYDVNTVNRFEQALGRAVRSSADFAAVFLVGTDIAAFIGKRSVRDLLESRTLVQVDLGRDLTKLTPGTTLPAALKGMVQALIGRDNGWKDTHRKRVKAAQRVTRQGGVLTVHELLATAVRSSWVFAKARNFQAAVPILREAINNPNIHKVQKAELLYRIASYLHQFDSTASADAYRAAFNINSDFPRPQKIADKKFAKLSDQAVAVRDYFVRFAQPNAALARLDQIAAKLSFALDAEVIEQGLLELGEALGATATRPEKETGRGPDDLWLFDDIGFCLEAKSENKTSIHKTDAAQLTLSLQWCNDNVMMPEKGFIPIFVSNTSVADRAEDISFGPSLLTEQILFDLIVRLKKVVLCLSFDGPLFSDPAAIMKALNAEGLAGRQIATKLGKLSSPH
ncbi:DEAD/DEAH box helicase family protein [Geopseudomonas guangdongensis]|uniref:Helicase C-terminal domain-containing protein n=1 Tax=Geopseudomonas guangdongensis TaxID=1245526 RepID=A0A1H2I1S3_9GAMM|nr:DEAD/DEAH box helicase family protein [Pseudomonas guangdongensis]SDU37954.1 Helicase C-terminal domain-containing protein [Pseudomonas guangdongensis]